MILRLILLLFISGFVTAKTANDFVRVIDKGEPISLDLEVNKEIQIQFDYQLKEVGISSNISNNIAVESIDSRLWLKANKPFTTTKLLIKDKEEQISILLLSASTKTVTHKNYIIVKQKQITQPYKTKNNTTKQLNLVVLTRFVAQKFYGPKRLVNKLAGVYRVHINNEEIELFVCSSNLACNDNVIAIPKASWQSNDFVITAVILTNTTKQNIELDPRDLIGNWLSATFHFNILTPKGETMLYLVSHNRFEQAYESN